MARWRTATEPPTSPPSCWHSERRSWPRVPGGIRTIAAGECFTGFLETALEPDELLTEIRVPKVPDAGWSFQKFHRRAQDWAIVGCAVVRNGTTAGIGLVNMGSTPLRAAATESALADGATIEDAASLADAGTQPPDDIHGSSEYRRHLSRVLVRRALAGVLGLTDLAAPEMSEFRSA